MTNKAFGMALAAAMTLLWAGAVYGEPTIFAGKTCVGDAGMPGAKPHRGALTFDKDGKVSLWVYDDIVHAEVAIRTQTVTSDHVSFQSIGGNYDLSLRPTDAHLVGGTSNIGMRPNFVVDLECPGLVSPASTAGAPAAPTSGRRG